MYHVLHLRVFEALCERMGLQHPHLIFYAEVIRFSRGRVLPSLFDLREANKFLRENSLSKELRSKKMWIDKLAFLADIFSRLNDGSSSPQGYCNNIFTVGNKTLKKS